MSNQSHTRQRQIGIAQICILILLLFLMQTGLAKAEYELARSSVNQGGTAMSSTGYSMGLSVGQNATGTTGTGEDILYSGFWYLNFAEPEYVELTAANVTSCPTSELAEVPVVVGNFVDILGLQLRIGFDPSVIVPTGDTISSKYLTGVTVGGTSDRISLNWDGDLNNPLSIPDGDTLLTLLFQPTGNQDDVSGLIWDDDFCMVFDVVGNSRPLQTTDGAVALIDDCTTILDSIAIEGPDTVNENTTAQYQCRAFYSDGSDALVADPCDVTWGDACAPYAGIDACGLFTAGDVDSPFQCDITAEYTESSETRDTSFTVTIVPVSGWRATIHSQGEIVESNPSEDYIVIGVEDAVDTLPKPPVPPTYTTLVRSYWPDWSGPYQQDIRMTGEDGYCWVIEVNPHGNVPPPTPRCATLSWDPSEFTPEGSYRLLEGYSCTGAAVVSDMRAVTEYQLCGADAPQYFTVVWDTLVCVEFDLMAGWNLISMPVIPDDPSVASLFPTADVAYEYDGVYVPVTELESCTGYWLRVPAATAVEVCGVSVDNCTTQYARGWHLIGGPNCIIAPVDDPPGCLEVIYGYNGVYVVSDVLQPTYGYWIRTGCDLTDVIMDCSASPSPAMKQLFATSEPEQLLVLQAHSDLPDKSDCSRVIIGLGDNALTLPSPPDPPDYSVKMAVYHIDMAESFYESVQQRSEDGNLWVIAINPYLNGNPQGSGSVTVSWDATGLTDDLYVVREGIGNSGSIIIGDMRSVSTLEVTGGNEMQYYTIECTSIATDVDEPDELPSSYGYELRQCYPNPFNPSTAIEFSLPVRCHVRLEILNLAGQRVNTIADDYFGAGEHTVRWMGEDYNGNPVASGVYFYRLVSDNYTKTMRMVLVK